MNCRTTLTYFAVGMTVSAGRCAALWLVRIRGQVWADQQADEVASLLLADSLPLPVLVTRTAPAAEASKCADSRSSLPSTWCVPC